MKDDMQGWYCNCQTTLKMIVQDKQVPETLHPRNVPLRCRIPIGQLFATPMGSVMQSYIFC